jgi:hypothetical protein
MKTNPMAFHSPLTFVLLLALAGTLLVVTNLQAQSQPKRVLVVSTTTGFRHDSIPTAETILGELAKQSGVFTVDYARVDVKDAKYKGADGKPDKAKYEPVVAAVLAEKMSPAALKQLDLVVFALLAICRCRTNRRSWTGSNPAEDSLEFIRPRTHFMDSRPSSR